MIEFPKHTLVIGATGTGKGVICHSAHEKFLAANPLHRVYLLCNKVDEKSRYGKHPRLWTTMDQAEFLHEVQRRKAPREGFCDTMAIVDEAFAWDWKNRESGLQYIPNAARAHGVFMWVTSQFPTQMAPTVRANCDNIICFAQRPDGAEWAAKQYHPDFSNATRLPDGWFIRQEGIGAPRTGCAWYKDESGKFHKA